MKFCCWFFSLTVAVTNINFLFELFHQKSPLYLAILGNKNKFLGMGSSGSRAHSANTDNSHSNTTRTGTDETCSNAESLTTEGATNSSDGIISTFFFPIFLILKQFLKQTKKKKT